MVITNSFNACEKLRAFHVKQTDGLNRLNRNEHIYKLKKMTNFHFNFFICLIDIIHIDYWTYTNGR